MPDQPEECGAGDTDWGAVVGQHDVKVYTRDKTLPIVAPGSVPLLGVYTCVLLPVDISSAAPCSGKYGSAT